MVAVKQRPTLTPGNVNSIGASSHSLSQDYEKKRRPAENNIGKEFHTVKKIHTTALYFCFVTLLVD